MGDKNPKIQKIIQERERGQSDAFNKSYNEYSKFEIIYNNPNFLRVLTYQATIDAVIYDIDEILKDAKSKLTNSNLSQKEKLNIGKYIVNLSKQKTKLQEIRDGHN